MKDQSEDLDAFVSVDKAVRGLGSKTKGLGNPTFGVVEKADARWGTRYRRRDGKIVMNDGLVSRSGYRRILPEARSVDWHDEYQIDELEDVAKAVLREKRATIFEALVLDPLRGKPGKTIDDLARQFGKSADTISRIKHKCKIRVQAEI